MPQRLEADDIINGNNSKLETLDVSLKQSLSISSPIVSSAHNSGFFVNGKCSIPIVEKARRVYVPNELLNRSSIGSISKDKNKLTKKISSPTSHHEQQQQNQNQSQNLSQHLQLNENEFSPLILDDYEKFADDDNKYVLESLSSHNLKTDSNSNNNNSSSNNNERKNVYKLSEGLQKSQVIQSYDILFP